MELIEVALERARFEYTELADNWKSIEHKAQSTAVVAGIFLAAMLPATNSQLISTATEIHFRIVAALLACCLIGSICCAIRALKITHFDMPPSAQWTWNWVRDALALRKVDDELLSAKRDLYREFIDNWLGANRTLEERNTKKSSWVRHAQRFLAAGALLTALLILNRIVNA